MTVCDSCLLHQEVLSQIPPYCHRHHRHHQPCVPINQDCATLTQQRTKHISSPRDKTRCCDNQERSSSGYLCSLTEMDQRSSGPLTTFWAGLVHSTRVSLTHTSNRSARTTSAARRHAAAVTRLIWECTSTTTWLLFLLSQTPYTRAVSAVVTFDDHQFDSSFRPDQSQCINSLLLDRHRIPPSAFTSTSDLSDPSGTRDYTAENLRSVNAERAWCPSRRIGTELTEFVQVDMSELNAITKMVINGLQAEEGGSRFTPHFYIRYKREMNEKEWRTYRPRDPKQTSRLVGSASALVPKFVVLDPPLIARWFRIYPYRDSPGFVCVRLEAYGCRFVDDLVEYQIPEGSLAIPPYLAPIPSHPLSTSPVWRKTEVMSLNNQSLFYEARSGAAFSDLCYDGYRIEPGGLLDGGLGCLTDMAISSPTTRPTPRRSAEPNPSMHEALASEQNHWFVGWHRSRWRATKGEAKSDDVVDMLFRFVSVRDFKRLRLYASNNYPEKVRLPRRIEVRFSVRGSLFSTQPVVAKDFPMVNHSSEVKKIELNLEGRIGQFLQLKAYFADDWLLFNEVKFVSFEAAEPTPIEEPTVTRHSKKESSTSNIPRTKESTALPVESLDLTSIHRLPTVIVLALLIAAFLVVIGCAFIWIYWKRKNLREAKHRRALSLALDIQVENNESLTNGRVGNIFPVNSQVLNANGTLPKKCPTKGFNELHHLMELNQNTPGRTISNRNNRLSGTTVPTSDEVSEADAFNPSGLPSTAFGRRVESSRSGLLASLKQSLCGIRRWERKPIEPNSHCVAAGLGSVQPLTMNCSMHQLAGSYESNAGQAYPNKNAVNHHHQNSTNNNIPGSNTNTNDNVGIIHGILSNPAGAVSFTDQLLPPNVPATPVRPLELPDPAASAVLLNCPISNPTMIHMATATAPDPELRSKAWRLQTAGMINPGAFGSIGSVQQELGLYTTVSGESDGESNCASTMSPEYATTSNIADQIGFNNAFSQLHQNPHQQQQHEQATAPDVLFTLNPACAFSNLQGHVTYMPPRQGALISPSLTFSGLPISSTTLATRSKAEPNSLIFSNPNGGKSHLIPATPMDLALVNSTRFYQPYSTDSQGALNSCLAAKYVPDGSKHASPVGHTPVSTVNPVLFTRIYGGSTQPQPQTQQQQQALAQPVMTPRLKRQGDVLDAMELSGSRSTGSSGRSRRHGGTRFHTVNTEEEDPWIRATFGKSGRMEITNGEHFLSGVRPPVPPSSPPPPPPSLPSSHRESSVTQSANPAKV